MSVKALLRLLFSREDLCMCSSGFCLLLAESKLWTWAWTSEHGQPGNRNTHGGISGLVFQSRWLHFFQNCRKPGQRLPQLPTSMSLPSLCLGAGRQEDPYQNPGTLMSTTSIVFVTVRVSSCDSSTSSITAVIPVPSSSISGHSVNPWRVDRVLHYSLSLSEVFVPEASSGNIVVRFKINFTSLHFSLNSFFSLFSLKFN